MFESVVTTILNKFLGDYVANLEGKQLNIGLFSGNVVLTELQLKKEALDKLNLPLEVFAGYLGRLELHIPWRNLKSQPVRVIIEDLFLLAGPRVETKYDPKLEEERQLKSKQEKLETAEIFANSVDNKLSEDVQQESFANKLVTKIVDNLQVTVKNIHIRFEDSSSNKERMFSVGVTLKELSAVSTDENWVETFIVDALGAVNKLVKLNCFSIYWNTKGPTMKDLSYEEFVQEARNSIGDESHDYILKPVSGLGKAILHKSINEDIPKTILNVFFDDFSLDVNYDQYYDILCFLAALSTAQRSLPYRRYKPVGDKVAPIEMFRYAVRCTLSDITERNKRRSWSYIMQRRADRNDYVKLYSRKLMDGKVHDADAKELLEMERRMDYDDLAHYRTISRAYVKKQLASQSKHKESWVWSWIGYKSPATSLVKDEDIKELYETIGFEDSDGAQNDKDSLPAKAQLLQLNFELAQGSFSISSSNASADSLVNLLFTKLAATFIQRPKTIAFALSLLDLKVVENFVTGSLFQELVKVKEIGPGSPDATEKSLLKFNYDQMVSNPDADAEIHLSLRPLQIIFNSLVVNQVFNFFLDRKTVPLLNALHAEAKSTFEQVSVKTRANLQLAMESHKGLDLNVKIRAPMILIPEDPTDHGKSLIAIDLGKLLVRTELVSSEQKKKIERRKRQLTEEETEEFYELLYDRMRLDISRIGMYFASDFKDWLKMSAMDSLSGLSEDKKIISEIDTSVLIESSIVSKAANLAQTKISGTLPQIEVFLSDAKMEKIMLLLNNLPKPPSATSLEDDKESTFNSNNEKRQKSTTRGPLINPAKPLKRKVRKASSPAPHESEVDEEFYDAFDDMQMDGDVQIDRQSLYVHFAVDKVQVSLSKYHAEDTNEAVVLSMMAEDFGLELKAWGTLTSIDFHLSSLGILEFTNRDSPTYILDGLQNDQLSDLLRITIQIVDPSNVDFKTIYEEIERSINISFNPIHLNVDTKKLYSVSEFIFGNVLPCLDAGRKAEDVTPPPLPTDSSLTSDFLEKYQPKTEVSFSLARFSILINQDTFNLCRLDANSFSTSLELVGKKLSLSGEISSLKVVGYNDQDLSRDPKSLLFFEGGSVAKFAFETLVDATHDYLRGSNVLRLDFGALVLVYESEILRQLALVAGDGLGIADLASQANKQPTSAEALKNSAPGAEVLTQTATYILIDLQSPVIVLPSRNDSSVLTFNLGRLNVHNSVTKVPEYSGFDQSFNISLSDICIALHPDRRESSLERILLQKFTIPLKIQLTANSFARKYADVEIDGIIEEIIAEMSENDYGSMMGIIMDVLDSVNSVVEALPKAKNDNADSANEATPANDAQKNEVEEKFIFDAQLELKGLKFLLKDNDDKERVRLEINGIEVASNAHSIRGLGLEVSVESINITDAQDPSQPYKDLFLIGLSAASYNEPLIDSRKQCLFRLDKKNDGSIEVNGYLESPRIFPIFDTIFYAQKFFLSNLPKVKSTSTPHKEGGTAKESDNTPQPNLNVTFNLIDASIIVVEDCKRQDTEALSLRIAKVTFEMVAGNIDLSVDGVTSNIYFTSSPSETSITIFENFSLLLTLKNDLGRSLSDLNLSIQPIVLTLSFKDLQLIQNILNSLTIAQSKYAHPPTSSSTSTIAGDSQRKESIISYNNESETSSRHESIIETPQNITHRLKEVGRMALDTVRVILIDDSASAVVPLLDVSIVQINCNLEDWSSQFKARLGATLSSSCYNPTVSYWEPIIEPWSFIFTMGPNEQEPNSDTVIMLSSSDGLNVAVVHHSLEKVLQFLQKLGANKGRLVSESRSIVAPYLVHNYMDFKVFIKGNGGNPKELSVEPLQATEFSFEDWRQLRTLAVTNRSSTANVLFGNVFREISHVNLDQDEIQKFPLKPVESVDDEGSGRYFYLHTYLENGIRQVYIRERMMIHNNTSHVLLFTFEGLDTGKTLMAQPEGKFSVQPWFEEGRCTVTPSGGKLKPFSEILTLCEPFQFDGAILVSNPVDPSSTEPVHVLLKAASHPRFGICDISIGAPVVIENLLPYNIQVQISQETSVKKIFSLTEGEQVPIYIVDPNKAFNTGISIPEIGLFSTSEQDVAAIKENGELSMQNELGLEVKVMLSKVIDEFSRVKLVISAYYLIVNQTGLTLQVQSNSNAKKGLSNQVTTVPSADEGKPMVLFSQPSTKSVKNRVRIRVADSEWSDPISFEAVGAEVEFDCKSIMTRKWYNLGGFVSVGQGKFGVSKIIYITPRYFAVNDTNVELSIADSEVVYQIPPNGQVPVHFIPNDFQKIKIKPSDVEIWSSSIDIMSTGNLYIREDFRQRLYRVGRTMRSPSIYLSFTFTDSWPYHVKNYSSRPLAISQKGQEKSYVCQPKSTLNYSWDEPSAEAEHLTLEWEGQKVTINPSEIGRKFRLKIKDKSGRSLHAIVEVKADGPAVVLYVREKSSRVSDEVFDVSEDVSGNYDDKCQSVILLQIPFVAMSLIGPDLQEFLLLYMKNIEVRYAVGRQFISYGLTIRWLQLDNQSFDWEHPMLLYPAVLSKSEKELNEHPVVSLGIIQSKDRSYGVTYYKYFGLLLQELAIELGEELLRRFLDFVNLSVMTVNPNTILTEEDYKLKPFRVERDSSEMLFFEFFQLHPIKLNLTFSRTEESPNKGASTSYNPITAMVNILTMAVGNISDAPLKFNALVFENILAHQSTLTETVIDHYKQAGIAQFHKVLGSADFLGNPVGLFNTLGSGVTDLFYEPYQGFVSDRPQDIGIGFARGGLSLVKKTVSGLSGTLSKFTGSLAKGLSAATMDKSFQQKRRIDRARNKPRHALSGVSTGVLQLYSGLKSGITGVVDKPLEGAKEGGVGGFLRGVGVGLVGVVTKPVVGLFDMTTSLTEGIQGSADDNPNLVQQVRFPRVVPVDKKVRAYDTREAFGQSILINIIGEDHVGNEYYLAHIEVPGDNALVILTDRRLMYASVGRLRSIWDLSLQKISGLRITPDSLIVSVNGEAPRSKLIPVVDMETKKWFAKIIEDHIQDNISQ